MEIDTPRVLLFLIPPTSRPLIYNLYLHLHAFCYIYNGVQDYITSPLNRAVNLGSD